MRLFTQYRPTIRRQKNPGNPDSFIYSGASWLLLFVAMRGATSVLGNGDIVAYNAVNPHPTWGELKVWFLTKFTFMQSLEWIWDTAFSHTKYLKLSEKEFYVRALHENTQLNSALCEGMFQPVSAEMTATNGGDIFNIDLSRKFTQGGFWDVSQEGIDGTYVDGRVPSTRFMTVGIGGQIAFIDRAEDLQFTTSFYANTAYPGYAGRDIQVEGVRGGYDVLNLIRSKMYEWGTII